MQAIFKGNTLRIGLALAALTLPAAIGAQAKQSVLADFESGSNQNNFMAYHFFYDDSKDGGNSQVTSSTKSGAELLFDPAVSLGEGNMGTKGAKLAFTMGSTKPSCGASCTYGNMVGFGTGLIAEGKTLDITGATKITFWAKASAPMTVRVEVATSKVTDFAYHRIESSVTTTWTEYTINLLDQGIEFKQPSWTVLPVDFDPKTVEKLQFQVSTEDNLTLTAGTLFIDDIKIEGYEWEPPTACKTCLTAAGSGAGKGATLSDFDTAPKNKNTAGGFWYAYNDAEGRVISSQAEYSEIFGGVTPNTTDPTKPTIAVAGMKGHGGGDGAFIEFKLGPSYVQGPNTIMPFVGIGTKLSDNLETAFTNAKGAGATGLYFDYKTTGDVDYIRLEVVASPAISANTGIVHHVLLKGTAGEWKGATVPFTALQLPDWEEVKLIADKTLKTESLDKVQFAFQGAANKTGSIAVDNLIWVGATTAPTIGVGGSAIFSGPAKSSQEFSVLNRDGMLQVSYRLPQGIHTGRLDLVDLQGKLVSRTAIRGEGGLRQSGFDNLRPENGTYLLKLETWDQSGRPFSTSTRVTLLN